jgi:hypothetical protein
MLKKLSKPPNSMFAKNSAFPSPQKGGITKMLVLWGLHKYIKFIEKH